MLIKAKQILIAFIFITSQVLGQETIWLENEVLQKSEQYYINNYNSRFHSSVKTYMLPDSVKESVYGPEKWHVYYKKEVKKNKFIIIPIIQTVGGISISDSTQAIGQLGFGLALQYSLGSKLYLSLSAYFEDGKYPNYINNYIEDKGVVPGMGRAYSGEIGYNFTRIDALIAYRPFDYLSLEAGIGKHFIGDGYRSFFVSDIASNNPYGRLNVNIWHLNFSATYSSLTHFDKNEDGQWNQAGKYSARHYLTWNATKWFKIGLFESVVWQASDSSYYRGFDPHYINPIQFYRPVEYSIGSADNSLLGFDLGFKIKKRWILYSQFMLDEFLLREVSAGDGWWGNKFAIQLGMKAFEPFSVKNMFLRLEFNLARPFTFSHGSPKQNYAQLGEAIGHPIGANFYEGIVELNFGLGKRARLENLFIAYLKGEDPIGENMGGDIFKPYTNPTNQYGNHIGQGDQRIVGLYTIKYSYLLSSENRLKFIAGFQIRGEHYLDKTSLSTQIFAGISTTIWNRYYGF